MGIRNGRTPKIPEPTFVHQNVSECHFPIGFWPISRKKNSTWTPNSKKWPSGSAVLSGAWSSPARASAPRAAFPTFARPEASGRGPSRFSSMNTAATPSHSSNTGGNGPRRICSLPTRSPTRPTGPSRAGRPTAAFAASSRRISTACTRLPGAVTCSSCMARRAKSAASIAACSSMREAMVAQFQQTQAVPRCERCGGLTKHATISFGQALADRRVATGDLLVARG